MTTRRQESLAAVGEPVLLELLDRPGEELRRDGQVERVVAAGAALVVELLDGRREPVEGGVVVEVARDEPEALGELAARPPRGTRVRACCLHRVVHDLREVLVGPVAPGEADQREARRQQPAVGQVVDRRHQLLAGQVAGDTEDAPGRTGRRCAAAAGRRGRAAGCAAAADRWLALVRPRDRRQCPQQRRQAGLRGRSGAAAAPGGRGRRARCASPAAWALMKPPKVKGRPGISRSCGGSAVICRKTPVGGPPLWYCPVECRKRGPQPKVTGRPVRGRERVAHAGQVRRRASAVEVGHHGEVAVLGVELPEQRGDGAGDGASRRRAARRWRRTSTPPSVNAGVGRLAAAVEQVAGGLLGALDVGLVERVDAEDPAGDGGRVLPQQHLRAERARTTAAPPAGGRRRVHVSPEPIVTSTSSVVLGEKFGASSGRRRRPAGCPCRSCRSTRRSAARPSRRSRRCRSPSSTSTSLSRRRGWPPPSAAPSRSAGLSAVVGLRARGWIAAGLVEQLGRCRRRPGRSARGRTRSAPSSGRRRRGRR